MVDFQCSKPAEEVGARCSPDIVTVSWKQSPNLHFTPPVCSGRVTTDIDSERSGEENLFITGAVSAGISQCPYILNRATCSASTYSLSSVWYQVYLVVQLQICAGAQIRTLRALGLGAGFMSSRVHQKIRAHPESFLPHIT